MYRYIQLYINNVNTVRLRAFVDFFDSRSELGPHFPVLHFSHFLLQLTTFTNYFNRERERESER